MTAEKKPALMFSTSAAMQRNWGPDIARHLAAKGYDIVRASRRPPANLSRFSQVIIWNGETAQSKRMARAARTAGISLAFVEVGFFSQRSHWMLSRNGSVGGALFSGEEIPLNMPEDEAFIDSFFAQYAAGRQPTTGGGVVGMLQLAGDYAIMQHSPFSTMQQFIDIAEDLWPDIRFRVHPKDPRPNVKTRHPLLAGRSLWDDVLPADLIVGINSTTLYEAVLAGKPVHPFGGTPLQHHDHRAVVREIIRRQIPKEATDIDHLVFRSLGRVF